MPSFFCMPFFACNRQVDSIDKRQCNLQNIPHEIERYSRTLEELLLDMNHIRDLPKSLFRLYKLRRLGLSDNDIHRLPAEIAALQNLVELNISRNDISDLPEELRDCRNLIFLDVSSNPIARLPDSITQVTSLTHLALNDTSLTKLPQDIGHLKTLKSLELRENHLRTLPSSIVQLVNLIRLDLGQNELDILPAELGALCSLQELYADDNSIESLPESILQCIALEQLDMSSNRLLALPNEIGELVNLVDMTLSHNCLSFLPNSIGRLKRLSILRMDDNSFLQLTPAIGSCTSLNELYLTQNLISELPSTIGNLRSMQNLNADKNHLIALPPLIGECCSLTLLSLRDNQIEELPMEIGKLTRLRVLDVCNNRLKYLPFTINVLFNLQALWLSENQSQALLKFQQDVDTRTGMKVLTCYLLPQQSENAITNEMVNRMPNRSFVGGPKVHFGELGANSPTNADETADFNRAGSISSVGAPLGNFERHGTPHPKPGVKGTPVAAAAKPSKKTSIDGHVIPHIGEHSTNGQTIMLSKKPSVERADSQHESASASKLDTSGNNNQCVTLRPALKHSTAAFHLQNQQQKEQRTGSSDYQKQAHSVPFVNKPSHSISSNSFSNFATSNIKQENESNSSSLEKMTKRVVVRREPHHGLGLSIAGGLESNPYVKDDCGLFISKLIPGAPAERVGLHVGDKILEINGVSMINQRHDVAVECIQKSPDVLNLVVIPKFVLLVNKPPSTSQEQSVSAPGNAQVSSSSLFNTFPNLVSTTCRLNEHGYPMFSLRLQSAPTGGGTHFIVVCNPSSASSMKTLDQSTTIEEGDRLLSVNGINIDGKSLAETTALLRGAPGAEVYLLLQRQVTPPRVTATDNRKLITDTLPTSTISAMAPIAPPIRAGSILQQHVVQRSVATPPSASILAFKKDAILDNSTHTPQALANGHVTSETRGERELTVADLPPGDTRFDGKIEEIELSRDSKNALGLSIVGGVDHCSHPFGTEAPGIFVSKIADSSPAAKSRRLRVGDRILSVNEHNLEYSRHADAVEILKKAGPQLRICVRHDAQPRGLRHISFRRQDNTSKLGISICGGINTPMLPNDPNDEGIFVESVDPRGNVHLEAPQLRAGMRILEVNDESLLGCSRSESAELLRNASSPIRLLVCDGVSEMIHKASASSLSNFFASSSQLFPPQSTHSPAEINSQSQQSPQARQQQHPLRTSHDKDTNQHATRFSTNLASYATTGASRMQDASSGDALRIASKMTNFPRLKSDSNATIHSSSASSTNLNNGHQNREARFMVDNETKNGPSSATISDKTFAKQPPYKLVTGVNETSIQCGAENHSQNYVNVRLKEGELSNGNNNNSLTLAFNHHNNNNNNNDNIKFVDEPSEG